MVIADIGNGTWLTTLKTEKRPLELERTYSEAEYRRFDNYDAISVQPYTEIPQDYQLAMGVPLCFLWHWDERQFEVIDYENSPRVDGKKLYKRIIIKRKW